MTDFTACPYCTKDESNENRGKKKETHRDTVLKKVNIPADIAPDSAPFVR
jgi:hypothetical protein